MFPWQLCRKLSRHTFRLLPLHLLHACPCISSVTINTFAAAARALCHFGPAGNVVTGKLPVELCAHRWHKLAIRRFSCPTPCPRLHLCCIWHD